MTRVLFDNTDLSEFGYIFHKDIDEVPEHDYEEVTILGKNGTLLIDNKRMKNVSESYDIAITDNSTADLDRLRNFLASKVGFKRLEDNIRPNHYVMAKFDDLNSRLPSDRSKATATIKFTRKPERWLKSGDTPVSASELLNPTYFDSHPLIRCYGNGSLTINSQTITVASNPYEYVDIDCNIMDAFCGANNANQYVSFDTDFVVLRSGTNSITHNMTNVLITPRWYEV